MAQVESHEQEIRTNCRACHGGCGVLVTVKDGVIDKIEGDPAFPTNHGTICSKGLAFKQLVYHPDRLQYPLKRAGGGPVGTDHLGGGARHHCPEAVPL